MATVQEYASSNPSVVVVDNVLSPGALERIRQALALSTVWCVSRERGGRGRGVCMSLGEGTDERHSTLATL